MKTFDVIVDELRALTTMWETELLRLDQLTIAERLNSQKRNIRKIVGHMVDSASNNTHRIIHLQYQDSPLDFPNYASNGNNDRWISIQNYQTEDWHDLVQLWKYSNLHIAHVIQNVDHAALAHEWLADKDKKITLEEMIVDYLRHFKLHIKEIKALIEK